MKFIFVFLIREKLLIFFLNKIVNNVNFILIDEPVVRVDINKLVKIIYIGRTLKQEWRNILQVEHHFDYISEISNYIFQGRKHEFQ